MNRKERRRAAKAKLSDIIEIFLGLTANDEEMGWFWYARRPGSKTGFAGIEEAIVNKQLHGPFKSDAAAAQDAFGGDLLVSRGGMWDPAWDKLQ